MAQGRKPFGERALSSTERVHRSRENRPRTEQIAAAAARTLREGVRAGWIPEDQALAFLMEELEGEMVGPDKRRLTKAEREAIARKALGLEGDST